MIEKLMTVEEWVKIWEAASPKDEKYLKRRDRIRSMLAPYCDALIKSSFKYWPREEMARRIPIIMTTLAMLEEIHEDRMERVQ